ncbi:MAG: signal peptidase I [Candidatus Bathyarchaeia archaeon]
MAYIIPTICWVFPTIITLHISSYENIRQWSNRQTTITAILIAALQLSALIGVSFFTSFGKSPYVHTPTSIAFYIAYFTSPLIAFETSRAYLIKSCPKKRIFFGLALTSLFYTFISFPLAKFLTLSEPAETAKFMSSSLLPTLAQNLLATYLALLGGPAASMAYLGVLEAFEWLSPILPNPSWAIKALITTLTPTIGFLTINQTVRPFTLMRYGIISKAEAKPKPHRTKKTSSSLSWITIALTALILVWSSTGLLGFQSSIIASGSMRPTLDVGDIAITVPTPPEKIKVGDIIQYWREGESAPTIHRVIEINSAGGITHITTKGDANNAPDEPITATKPLGKVIFVIPKLGWVSIYLKDFAANAYTFLTTTLPKALTGGSAKLLANIIPITAALTLTAHAFLLLAYHKTTKKGG